MHIISLLWSFIGVILLWYFWIRLVQHLFLQNKKQFSIKMWITSIILVGSLYGFDMLLTHLGITIESWISRIGSFILYVSLLFLFLMFWNQQQKNRKIRFLASIRIILLAIVGMLGIQYGIQWVALLLIGAYIEEFLKIISTETQIKKADFFSSDILTFSVLIALGFSIVENILYTGTNFFFGEGGSMGLVVGRWIFASGLHFLATGIIALLLFKLYQNVKASELSVGAKLIRIVIGMLAGVMLHFCYNFCISQGRLRIYGIVVIGGFFLLSYLLFLSDRLYQEEEKL